MGATTALPDSGERPSVAVIGSGVAGLTAAHLLARTHRVTLFEADDRVGGHAHTHWFHGPSGRRHAVDSGFIVHNDRTYPLLRRLFAELGVTTQATEMSMSVHCLGCGLAYAGGRGAGGVLAQPRRSADVRFARLLIQVTRFQRRARSFLAQGDSTVSLGEFLNRNRVDPYTVGHYVVPLVSCVWSTGRVRVLDYPAHYLFRFLDHHGMLTVGGSAQWYTVRGGSAEYVRRIAVRIPQVRTGIPVVALTRGADRVELRDAAGAVFTADRAVVATHADQALALLADPSDAEKRVLSAFRYSRNDVLVHTDSTVLPPAPRARASWNYLMPACAPGDAPVQVTYWMNRLQAIEESEPFLVTLNDHTRIDPARVLRRITYHHPVYDAESVAAQSELASLATSRTVYAGAYHGWGFHEDGCRSGVAAAAQFGAGW